MIRAVINRMLKAALSELFVDAASDAVHVSMGADMFADSKIHLNNMNFRPDIFDALLQPLKLISGHLGKLSIEGIAELALGGKLKCNIEDVYLLFRVDSELDAQRVQFLKKILTELNGNESQHELIRELLKKIQGFGGGKEMDFKKKRMLFMRTLNYFFNSMQLVVKTIHIRIESTSAAVLDDLNSQWNAFGITIPYFSLLQGASSRPQGLGKTDPAVTFCIRSLQIYADYDRESYCKMGNLPSEIMKSFAEKWKTESHTALLLPLDVEVVLGAEIQKRGGLFLPKIVITIPSMKFVVDSRQLEVLKILYEQLVHATIRNRQLLRIRVAYTRDEIPRLFGTGGSHILPQLSSGQLIYPAVMSIPRNAFGLGLVALLKAKMGARWAKALWKHLIRIVLEDVRYTMPLGKWIRVANLAFARKDYAFAYCKLLKKSKDTGNYIYDVNANIEPETIRKLFEYEMKLPVSSIQRFRSLANMIALVEAFNMKRLQTKISRSGGFAGALTEYEGLNISWKDLILIQTELLEAQQESAFKSFSKRASSAGVGRYMGGDDNDDDSTVVSDSNSSVYSYSAGSSQFGGPVSTQRHPTTPVASNVAAAPAPSTGKFSFLSRGATPLQPSTVAPSGQQQAATKTGMFHSTMRMFHAVKHAAALPTADELDSKLFGRSEILAFGDIFGKSEPDIRATSIGKFDRAAFNAAVANSGEKVSPFNLDFRLQDPSPSIALICDSVRWVLLRHQRALTIVPPDLSVSVTSIRFTFRMPLINGMREDLLTLKMENVSMNVLITSQLFATPATTTIVPPAQNLPAVKVSSGHGSPAALISGIKNMVGVDSRNGTGTQHATPGPSHQHHNGKPPHPGSPTAERQSVPNQSGVNVVRSLQGFASLVGSLIQLKAVVGSVALEIFVKDRELMIILNGRHGEEANVAPTTATNIDHSRDGEKVLAYMKQQQAHYAHLGIDSGAGTVTVLQAIEVAEKEEQAKLNEPQGFSVFSCPDSFLTLCIMMDFDETTEGAADVQLALGKMRTNVCGSLLSRFMDTEAVASVHSAGVIINQVYSLMALAEETAYVIDCEQWISSAVMSYYGVKSTAVRSPSSGALATDGAVHNGLDEATETQFDTVEAASTSDQSSDVGESTINLLSTYYDTPSVSPAAAVVAESDKSKSLARVSPPVDMVQRLCPDYGMERNSAAASLKRQDMLDHLNYSKWHIIARHYVPTVLTVLVRTSPIIVHTLAASTIRNLLQAFVHRLADRASKRPEINSKLASGLLSLQSGLTGFSSFLQLLVAARDMNSRDKENQFQPDEIAKLKMPALEVSMLKTVSPTPMIDAKIFGIELKLPVNDETICQGFALCLATLAPFYR